MTTSVWFEFTTTETVNNYTGQPDPSVLTSVTADGVTVLYYSVNVDQSAFPFLSASGYQYVLATTQFDGFTETSPANYYIFSYYDYINGAARIGLVDDVFGPDTSFSYWVQVQVGNTPSALFTTGAETVNFNNLTGNQPAAVDSGADLYNALGGGDTITLPNANPTDTSVTLAGTNVTFYLTHPFVLGDGPSDTTSVTGTGGSYNLVLGAGSDTVTVNGNGNSCPCRKPNPAGK